MDLTLLSWYTQKSYVLHWRNIANLVPDYLKDVNKLCTAQPSVNSFLNKLYSQPCLNWWLTLLFCILSLIKIWNCVWTSSSNSQICSLVFYNPYARLRAIHLNLAKDWLSRIPHLYYLYETSEGMIRENFWFGPIKSLVVKWKDVLTACMNIY